MTAPAAHDVIKFDPELVRARQRHYETIFILSPALDDKAVEALIEKTKKILNDNFGTLLRADDWGKKRMAFEIEKHAQARYIYFRYVGRAETVNEVERSLKLNADVLRYKTVKMSDVLSDEEIKSLVERAPEEPPKIPGETYDDEDFASFR